MVAAPCSCMSNYETYVDVRSMLLHSRYLAVCSGWAWGDWGRNLVERLLTHCLGEAAGIPAAEQQHKQVAAQAAFRALHVSKHEAVPSCCSMHVQRTPNTR